MTGLQTISRIAKVANRGAAGAWGTDGIALLELMQVYVRAMNERIAAGKSGTGR